MTNNNNDIKNCLYCGEEIKINAKKCRFCNSWLEDEKPKQNTFKLVKQKIEEDDAIVEFKKIPKKPIIISAIALLILTAGYFTYNYITEEIAKTPLECNSEFAQAEIMKKLKPFLQETAQTYVETTTKPRYSYWYGYIYNQAEDIKIKDVNVASNGSVTGKLFGIIEKNIEKNYRDRSRVCSAKVSIDFKKTFEINKEDKINKFIMPIKYNVKRIFNNSNSEDSIEEYELINEKTKFYLDNKEVIIED